MSEKDIQAAIIQYLEIKRIFHYRNNTGAFVRPDTKSFYRFGVPGAPDVICVINGKFIGIEVKRPGGKQSAHQQGFQASLEQAGGIYILAYSLDDVIQALKSIP